MTEPPSEPDFLERFYFIFVYVPYSKSKTNKTADNKSQA